jgi:hypothetical protein
LGEDDEDEEEDEEEKEEEEDEEEEEEEEEGRCFALQHFEANRIPVLNAPDSATHVRSQRAAVVCHQ